MALAFDGSNDEIDFGAITALNALPNLSVAFWVQPKTGIAANDTFVEKKSANTTGWRIGVHASTTTTTMFMTTAGTVFGALASALTLDTWVHFVWVYNGAGATNADRLKLWMNGVAQTVTFTGTIPTTNLASDDTNVRYGRNSQNALFTACWLEHAMLWTSSLRDDQAAAQHALAYPVTTDSLRIWTPLQSDQLTSIPDFSGNGHTGTASGVTATSGALVPKYHDDTITPARAASHIAHTSRNRFRRLSPLVPFYQRGYLGGGSRL